MMMVTMTTCSVQKKVFVGGHGRTLRKSAGGLNRLATATFSFRPLRPVSCLPPADWRTTAKPITNSKYPAKEHCSNCGLCDTYFVHHVKEACAFIAPGDDLSALEVATHGRSRDLDSEDELLFGVTEAMMNAKIVPSVPGAQWTGIVTSIAVGMLSHGHVDAVVCVQSDADDRFTPRPFVARTVDDIMAARGVKPVLSPNLEVLATVEALDVRNLLFIGVGCQVRAIRAVQPYLNVDNLYVLGTNCTDNGTREGLDKFLRLAPEAPAGEVVGYGGR